MKKSSNTGKVSIWASTGDPFSKAKTYSETTEFVKETKKNALYSQGKKWRKILVTKDENFERSVPVQGRSYDEIVKAAAEKLYITSEGKNINTSEEDAFFRYRY